MHAGTSTGQSNLAMKDLKSLSGGERSFTLVSFILALGSEISTPFFAMDEFDVFMDAVNRKVSLTSILKFAREMKHVQFLLLSPLDMAVVEQSLQELNAGLRAAAMGSQVEEIPKDYIHTLVMQPPRDGAQAHY
jgi:ABC-type cobalamin/Fe3+-siderophores transport system ATPase subunit